MKPLIYVIIGAVLIGGAAVHGLATQRWEAFQPSPERTQRMHALQIQYPGVTITEVPHDVPLKEKSIATSRRYTSTEQNLHVVTSIISGIPGAVATHTPDVCYSGSGYSCLRGPARESITLPGGGTATYFVADFERKRATSTERQRVRWCWSVDGTWTAPEYARFQFMKEPELYKLYVVSPLAELGPVDPVDPEPVREFIAAVYAQFGTGLKP
ncbi:MAG: hypothetical protein ACRCZF_11700 [Gemmataceae bacterium]